MYIEGKHTAIINEILKGISKFMLDDWLSCSWDKELQREVAIKVIDLEDV